MFVKACGITRLEDAAAAVRLGYTAIGMVFAESPRRVTLEQARDIAISVPASMIKVGVFVNEEEREVKRLMVSCGLDLVQFHGEEDPSYVSHFSGRAIKAFSPAPDFDDGALEEYRDCYAFLIDAFDATRRGGTGKLADWRTAARLALRYRVILAGGLSPSLVPEGVRAVRPFGLDASSGLESEPGIKDHLVMRRFLEAAKSASLEMEV